MIDPRREAIFVATNGRFEPRNVERCEHRPDRDRIEVVFAGTPRTYFYGVRNVRVVRDVRRVPTPDGGAVIEVDGSIWKNAVEVWAFPGVHGELWRRVFYRTSEGGGYVNRPASQVRIVPNAAAMPAVASVLGYFRDVVARLRDGEPLQRSYDAMDFIHPESALASYLIGAPISPRPWSATPIFPFRCNLSQRSAVGTALTSSVSVIEGPPGTGKTETILNLIANVVAVGAGTVGVVSFTNSAVANVRTKLEDHGFGHIVANLGNRENRAEFFAAQADRNARLRTVLSATPLAPTPQRIAELDRRIERLQAAERERAEVRQSIDAHRLELRHFDGHRERGEEPDLDKLPLLRRSSDRIVDFLVESELEHRDARRPGIVRRIRKYFLYGSMKGLDPDDAYVLVGLQRAYYDKRITELTARLEQLDEELRRGHFEALVAEHGELSFRALSASLGARYASIPRQEYSNDTYRRDDTFGPFAVDYPVLLSTCHSLPRSVAQGHLLDYLIIDEASQVDLLLAGLALSCCRNLVVVGDQRQLPPIVDESVRGVEPPSSPYDHRKSILASLAELYGDRLPRTLLREHYRCDPAIIGFCNKTFYGGELIPFTVGDGTGTSMIVVRTPEGNHMRQHREGGRSNQREIDVISEEVIRDHCVGYGREDIGITTPYRRQADRAADALIGRAESDTVHRYQGRQVPVMILTTVLSENWRGRTGLRFVDDPHKINVAVSRAIEKFVLVTNNDLMPTSRNIGDLVGYIGYHRPGEEVVDSAIVSVFDLLYDTYSRRLDELAGRLRTGSAQRSEAIIDTVLHDVLTDRGSTHLTVAQHVLLRNLFGNTSELTERQQALLRHRASVDFVVYNRVTNQPLLAVEVDGFRFHEDDPEQRRRDEIKNDIFAVRAMPLLRLATTGSGEHARLRRKLDEVDPPLRLPPAPEVS